MTEVPADKSAGELAYEAAALIDIISPALQAYSLRETRTGGMRYF